MRGHAENLNTGLVMVQVSWFAGVVQVLVQKHAPHAVEMVQPLNRIIAQRMDIGAHTTIALAMEAA